MTTRNFDALFAPQTIELMLNPDGKIWQEKLGEHHASLVSAQGLVYFLSDEGVTSVVKPGPVFRTRVRNN